MQRSTAERSVAPVIATIEGQDFTDIPSDLFIPPDALEVLLDSFTGPLDLLLYLIRRQQIDIMNIPIVLITRQYMQYIEWMEQHRLALAADYLVMAAMLAEIKSRLLLPRHKPENEPEEADPRMELVRRLQAYEQIKYASLLMDGLTQRGRDVFQVKVDVSSLSLTKQEPVVTLSQLLMAMTEVTANQERMENHAIQREVLSVRERMSSILARLESESYLDFQTVFFREEGRMGLVVSLLATLELAKQALLLILQAEPYSPIYLKKVELQDG